MKNEQRSESDPRAVSAMKQESLAELYLRHRGELLQFLLGLVRVRADADDVLQQVFLKLLQEWQTFRPETAKGWLFTVAYHEAMGLRRRRNLDAAARAELWARPVWETLSPISDPHGQAVRGEQVQAVRSALMKLPDAQREVVQRRIYRDQTFAAIARDLSCPLNTVLTRMRLALNKLKQLLEE